MKLTRIISRLNGKRRKKDQHTFFIFNAHIKLLLNSSWHFKILLYIQHIIVKKLYITLSVRFVHSLEAHTKDMFTIGGAECSPIRKALVHLYQVSLKNNFFFTKNCFRNKAVVWKYVSNVRTASSGVVLCHYFTCLIFSLNNLTHVKGWETNLYSTTTFPSKQFEPFWTFCMACVSRWTQLTWCAWLSFFTLKENQTTPTSSETSWNYYVRLSLKQTCQATISFSLSWCAIHLTTSRDD